MMKTRESPKTLLRETIDFNNRTRTKMCMCISYKNVCVYIQFVQEVLEGYLKL